MKEAQRFSILLLIGSIVFLIFLSISSFGKESIAAVLLIFAISLIATIYTTKRCKKKYK